MKLPGQLILFAVITGVTGLILLLLGYLIKAKQMAGLIAGYDPRRVKNVHGLTDWVGGNVMLIGGLICVYGLTPLILGLMPGQWFHWGFILIQFVLTLRTWIGAQRF